eukprot:TRINITY_DN5416_c0_g1_i1.p1 TRINITY_DN5416_c0_g1~~TRINITY_DN5416_c0_g1_i1.p1  ORF type:complete len:517 (-),score=163.23 TRINITY_DN5416_c0_g1_i1:119-1669(-)
MSSTLLEKTLKDKNALVSTESVPLARSHSDETFNVTQLDRQNSTNNVSLDGGEDDGLARTVGVMSSHSQITVRSLESKEAVELKGDLDELNSVQSIKLLCQQHTPGWASHDTSEITVKQLCEGLSNLSYAVSLDTNKGSGIGCVLFRIYGQEVSKMYDPAVELKIFKTLADYRIAPQIIANGEGWRIEEWHYAVTLPCALMNNSSVLCQVASNIGRMHKLHRRKDFPTEIPREPALQLRLQKWGSLAVNMAATMPDNETVKAMRIDEIYKTEVEWLPQWLLSHDTGITGQGLDLVFAHNDLQENNLLQTQYGIRMIDFEYSYFNYQSADLANFFCEFMIDYVTQNYHPFYMVNKSAYPSEEEQRLFCAVYLSEYLETPILPSDNAYVQPLLENIERFTLVSHLLWALWSVNRADATTTHEEFDFIHYGKYRLDCYLRTKADLLSREGRQPEAAQAPPAPPAVVKQSPSPAAESPKEEPRPVAAAAAAGVSTGAVLGIAAAVAAVAFVLGSQFSLRR